jgi:hypothetical protein
VPLPDLTTYTPHRRVTNAAFEGVPVPGLHAVYFQRAVEGRIASVARYSMGGLDLLLVWGWADEQHCRFSAVRDPGGFWHPAVEGCPVVELLRDGAAPDAPVTGLAIRTPAGQWVTADRTPARSR